MHGSVNFNVHYLLPINFMAPSGAMFFDVH